MSNKIELGKEGKLRPMLKGLFKKYVKKKIEESNKKMDYYFKVFPFLAQWAVDEEDAELILRYYGYLDNKGNIILNPDKKNKKSGTQYWDEEDYWDEYEEIYPGPSEKDDDEDENIYSELYPDVDEYWNNLENEGKKKGKNGKYKHSKKKKGKGSEDMFDITRPYTQGFIDETDLPEEEVESSVAQYIWFYPDYKDKTDKLEFNSLKDFDDFCAKNEFLVPPYVGERIAYRPVSHVCLNPGAKERGVDEIMGAESYGDMYYEACEELQLTYR
jgi:hypothetical protein